MASGVVAEGVVAPGIVAPGVVAEVLAPGVVPDVVAPGVVSPAVVAEVVAPVPVAPDVFAGGTTCCSAFENWMLNCVNWRSSSSTHERAYCCEAHDTSS